MNEVNQPARAKALSESKRTRLDIPQHLLLPLQQFADDEGHGNLSAALATLVKQGLPLLQQQRSISLGQLGTAWDKPAQSVPTLTEIRPSCPKTSATDEGGLLSEDPVIAYMAGLIEDF